MEDKNTNENDELKTISLKKYVWPDEAALAKEKQRNKKLKQKAMTACIVFLLVGWLGGSLLPYSFTTSLRNMISRSMTMDSSKKIEEVKNIMEQDWFFSKDIEDLDTRLSDQALEGITTNEEDPHTQYMSKEEMESFTQSINRNYIGIGVQYVLTDGTAVIEKVYKNTPAEKAGVQAGDILYSVDGEQMQGKTSAEIKAAVQGEAGTTVTIGFERNGKVIALDITRAEVASTTYGEMLENNIAYLQLYQFGTTTPDEVKAYLDDFSNAQGIVIDLRDNGGGYLDSVEGVASCFLEKGTEVMKQVFTNGEERITKTSQNKYTNIKNIVILVNENTASASEVLTLALKQQRDDVTIIGTTTYGKGTVQISKKFDDGSALKYTTSKWVSPDGTWVNGVGITPDTEVELHPVFSEKFTTMKEDETYEVDSVGDAVKDASLCLDYLGYTVDRTDGYFSLTIAESLQQFKNDKDLGDDAILDADTFNALRSAVLLDWNTTREHDTQLTKALEVLHG